MPEKSTFEAGGHERLNGMRESAKGVWIEFRTDFGMFLQEGFREETKCNTLSVLIETVSVSCDKRRRKILS